MERWDRVGHHHRLVVGRWRRVELRQRWRRRRRLLTALRLPRPLARRSTLDPVGVAAAGLAFAYALPTAYWLAGGTFGLNTVGGTAERLARERPTSIVAVLAITLVAKLLAGGLALVVARPHARTRYVRAALVIGIGLALYGGALVIAGLLALAGVVDGAQDEYALRWHAFFWDLWFFLWGVALASAARRAR